MNYFSSNPQILSLQPQLSFVQPADQTILMNSTTLDGSLFGFVRNYQLAGNDLNNLLSTLQLRQNVQTSLFKMQMARLLELKSLLLNKFSQEQQILNFQSQLDLSPKLSASSPHSIQSEPFKIESCFKKEEISMKDTASVSSGEAQDIKQDIKNILIYVLENYGRINESVFNSEKTKYQHNRDLSTVFELLTSKYASTIKTKEEMVKYILRKAFKFVKNNLKKGKNTNKSLVSKTLCDKYFHASHEEILKSGNEELYLKSVLPFRKDSKNKTMNTSFINAIFASDEFSRDYQQYLENFENILEADNQNKLDRFADTIKQFIQEGKINNINKYKRIPWPKIWIMNTTKIAQDLPNLVAQGLNQQQQPVVKKTKFI